MARFRLSTREARRDLLSIVVSLLLAYTAWLQHPAAPGASHHSRCARWDLREPGVHCCFFNAISLWLSRKRKSWRYTRCVTADPKPRRANFRRKLRWPRADVTGTWWYFRFTGNLARHLRNGQKWSRRQCKMYCVIGSSHVAKDDWYLL